MKIEKQYFYGIYGIQNIWHGEWADPEVVWHGKSFDYYDLEEALIDMYLEDLQVSDPYLAHFNEWLQDNKDLAREVLQNLMDAKKFY